MNCSLQNTVIVPKYLGARDVQRLERRLFGLNIYLYLYIYIHIYIFVFLLTAGSPSELCRLFSRLKTPPSTLSNIRGMCKGTDSWKGKPHMRFYLLYLSIFCNLSYSCYGERVHVGLFICLLLVPFLGNPHPLFSPLFLPFCSENDGDDSSPAWKPPEHDLILKLVAQVEYYFSDDNLEKDAFLLKHIRRNKMGYISVKLLTSFKKASTGGDVARSAALRPMVWRERDCRR